MKTRATRRQRRSAAIIKAVRPWQENPLVHSLTCGNDSQHAPLEAVEENGRVELHCRDCGYRQADIPEIVIKGKPSRALAKRVAAVLAAKPIQFR